MRTNHKTLFPFILTIGTLLFLTLLSACTNDIKDVNRIVSQSQYQEEKALNVEIIYSDSAEVKVRIYSPVMIRYSDKGASYDEFPEGLKVEFLSPSKKVTSWLVADYALRKDKEKKIFVERNVVLYNKKDDKLETDELVWDEEAEEVYTSRPVKISQPTKGDTSFGYGFKADQEFSRFEIKRKFSAIKNVDELVSDLEN
jgi:LPS export ABC transporter protein LptC